MALRLERWLGLALVLCAALALVLLPRPSDTVRVADRWPRTATDSLFERIRLAYGRLAWLELRDSLLPEVRRQGTRSPDSLLFLLDPGLSLETRAGLDEVLASLETAFAGKRLLSGVAVAFVVDTVPRVHGLPAGVFFGTRYEVFYYPPEDTGSNTCLAVAALRSGAELRSGSLPRWNPPFIGRLDSPASIVGPCAYYAIFGRPGTPIQRWLDKTRYLLAEFPGWLFSWQPEIPRHLSDPDFLLWYVPGIVSCAAGNRDYCRSAVLAERRGEGEESDSSAMRAYASARGSGSFRRHPFGDFARLYLSDVLSEMGPERFSRFWTSESSVDSAFAAAMGTSLEDWTMAWARETAGPWLPRPVPYARFVVLTLVAATALVGASALWATRRHVV